MKYPGTRFFAALKTENIRIPIGCRVKLLDVLTKLGILTLPAAQQYNSYNYRSLVSEAYHPVQGDMLLLVYTKTVDSVKRAR